MERNLSLTILLIAALIIFIFALYLYRPAQNNLTRVTVVGEAQSKVAPDTAVIIFSVVTQNSQAVNAQQENARKSEAVKKALETISAEAEIKTSNYNLQPEQDYSSSRMPKIIGYEVKNSVTVSISNLDQIGRMIDAATLAGANSVEGISFVLRENSPSRGAALAMATGQAMNKAESIAQSLGGKITRVVEISEARIAPRQPASEYSNAAGSNSMMSNVSRSYITPVEAGSLDVRSQVLLIVEIDVLM